MKHIVVISFLTSFIVGCASHTPAPVINRSPQPAASSSVSDDWRPNTYTVKKGDTLYSIGLEYGYDYREIAAANNIYAPFTINVGQILSFASLNTKASADGTQPATYENEDGVIVSPLEAEDTPVSTEVMTTATPEAPAAIPVLSEPKATREPYSLEAFNRTSPPVTPPTEMAKTPVNETAKPVEATKTAETKPNNLKPSVVDGIAWSWPTQGKVSAKFNAATNKGIDIDGKSGQAITASSAGKVIYTGSDLRGYGKLVIIKHSKTLLSVYAHNSNIAVKEGQIVKAGQKIAEMGDTDADKPKLHFEIRQKGKSVDPMQFLPQT